MPSPNGYEDLLRAATLIKTGGSSGPDSSQPLRPSREIYLEAVSQNAEALAAARIGLSRECMVPVRMTTDDLNSTVPNLGGLKGLAQAFAAEGWLAASEGRTNDAARSYLDAIQLGEAISQNGLLIDRLTGFACEAIGLRGLRDLQAGLNPAQCRQLIQQLERLDGAAPSAEEILANERNFARRAGSATLRLAHSIARLFSRAATQKAQAKFVQKANSAVREQRQFRIALAARAYELDHNRPPPSTSVLVPDYLAAPPLDPASGQPLDLAPKQRGDSP
jgi:hypothetical protein